MLSRRSVLQGSLASGCAGWVRGASADAGPPVPSHALVARAGQLRLPGEAVDRAVILLGETGAPPVLRLPKGGALDLSVTNALDHPFTLQWQGLRGVGAIGGAAGAGMPVAPGTTQALRIVPPDAGLFWFRAAALPGGEDLTARGMRGALVVEEAAPPSVDADVLLTVADWVSGGAGAQHVTTVNGLAVPLGATIVSGGRLRLRVLNASTTRTSFLAFEGARPRVIAIDGQPSDLFEPLGDAVPAGPGARFEFMIDLPRDAGAKVRLLARGSGDATVLWEATTTGTPRAPLPGIAALPPNPALPSEIHLDRATRATLSVEQLTPDATWRLNGVAALDLPAKPLTRVKRGAPVVLGLANRSNAVVPLTVHGQAMRLLHAKDDGWEPYWRNTVILLPDSVTHVAFVADAVGRWLVESALFGQASLGLRHWLEVVP